MRYNVILVPMCGLIMSLAELSLHGESTNTISSSAGSIEKICDQVADIRGLKFKNKVSTAVQTKAQFKEYIGREIIKQYGSMSAFDDYCKALIKLGALKAGIDAGMVQEMYLSQAAAHYDPQTGTYYLLMSDVTGAALDMVVSHELCHALQDQHFCLTNFVEGSKSTSLDNQDQQYAKQSLCEGDATVVMMVYGMKSGMGGLPDDDALLEQSVSLALKMQAEIGFDGILNMANSGLLEGDAVMGRQIDDMKKYPRFFMDLLVNAYLYGSVLVDQVRQTGGWAAVNKLYTSPPLSSEQIMHPEKYISTKDMPVDVRIADLMSRLSTGWRLVEEDAMGEIGIAALFKVWPATATSAVQSAAKKAAAGWAGDRYYYLLNAQGESCLVWKTVWDSEGDVREFVEAYSGFVKDRFEPDPISEKSEYGGKVQTMWRVTDSRYITLIADSKAKTALVLDSPDRSIPKKF